MVNRRLVFEHGQDTSFRAAATGYVALVTVLLCANYAAMWALTSLAVPDLLAKLVAEVTLLGVSYAVQQRFLFVRTARAAATKPAPSKRISQHWSRHSFSTA